MNILCKLGIHRPLKNHIFYFLDEVSSKNVYIAECSCGKSWLVNSPFSFLGYKMKKVLNEKSNS